MGDESFSELKKAANLNISGFCFPLPEETKNI